MIGAALLLMVAAPMSEATIAAERKAAPKDVQALLDRREGCAHWSGEEPYDAERKAEIDHALSQLRCNRLERDDTQMRRKYRHNPRVFRLIEAARSLG